MARVRRRFVWSTLCAAALAVGGVGCARDDVQRRPTDPRADRLVPVPAEAPPFAPDASGNREQTNTQARADEVRPPSLPVVDGELVKTSREEVVVRDAEGTEYALRVTPQTRSSVPLEEGTSVRAAWVMLDGELVVTDLLAPPGEAPPPVPSEPFPALPPPPQ